MASELTRVLSTPLSKSRTNKKKLNRKLHNSYWWTAISCVAALNFRGVYVVESNPCWYDSHEICRTQYTLCCASEDFISSPESTGCILCCSGLSFCISYGLTRIEMPGGKIPENAILSKSELGLWHAQRECLQSVTHETAQCWEGISPFTPLQLWYKPPAMIFYPVTRALRHERARDEHLRN